MSNCCDSRSFVRQCAATVVFAVSCAAVSAGEIIETRVDLPHVPKFNVVMTPIPLEGDGSGGGEPRGTCPQQQRTYVNPNLFNGGTYNLQGGLVETEIAAVSYLQPAGDFPFRIDTMEFILGTQAATVQTVTQYTVIVWEGSPNNGNQIFEFSSDDLILPHARIGPGTAGLNIQVSIDPNDPEQIIVSNNGSNRFSIGIRIDHHNNPPTATCSCGFGNLPAVCCPPQSTTNAFPATDTDGLASAANNWLFARACPGATGFCTLSPNGWFNFTASGMPTGDWVIRATLTPFFCAGFGRCCNPSNGNCTITTESDCQIGGGNWGGEGTSCTPNQCPQPMGACCRINGTCSENVILNSCLGVGESFFQNLTCAQVQCQQPEGACCTNISEVPCLSVDQETCASVYGGHFKGPFTECVSGACLGGCCFGEGNTNCLQVTKPDCTAQLAGQFEGVGATCNGFTCPQGACCLPSGACTFGTAIDCQTQGGNYQNGVSCASANCPQPTGACCLSNGGCLVLLQAQCGIISGANWAGPGTNCATGCTPSCPPADGDLNNDDSVNGLDVQVFSTALVNGGTPSQVCAGDFNGSSALDLGDIDGMVNALLTAP